MFIYFDLICTLYVVFYVECRKANLSRNTGLFQKEQTSSSSQQAPTLCTTHISDTHSSFSHFQLAFSSHRPKQAVCQLGIWKEVFLCDVISWFSLAHSGFCQIDMGRDYFSLYNTDTHEWYWLLCCVHSASKVSSTNDPQLYSQKLSQSFYYKPLQYPLVLRSADISQYSANHHCPSTGKVAEKQQCVLTCLPDHKVCETTCFNQEANYKALIHKRLENTYNKIIFV